MKLKDWADKQGISYLTAWRWFKAGDPRLANAYQSDSGTIIVPDEAESLEPSMNSVQDSDIMSVILKKTVEFSKNQYPVEDFAAWILSNFTLKIKGAEGPKYSRQKPKSEEVQKHFQQFLKPKGEKPKPNMFVAEPEALDDLVAKADDLTAQELVDEIHKVGVEVGAPVNPTDAPEVTDLMKDLTSAMRTASLENLAPIGVTTYDNVAEGVVARSVDLTPQQLNYTGSNNSAFSNSFSAVSGSVVLNGGLGMTSSCLSVPTAAPASAFYVSAQPQPEPEAPKARRGRKPSKNLGNK
jgi:hypothetical protein